MGGILGKQICRGNYSPSRQTVCITFLLLERTEDEKEKDLCKQTLLFNFAMKINPRLKKNEGKKMRWFNQCL